MTVATPCLYQPLRGQPVHCAGEGLGGRLGDGTDAMTHGHSVLVGSKRWYDTPTDLAQTNCNPLTRQRTVRNVIYTLLAIIHILTCLDSRQHLFLKLPDTMITRTVL